MKTASATLSAPLLALALASCTTLASEDLTPADLSVTHHHAGTLVVRADGSGRVLGLGAALVKGSELAEAVREAAAESRLFHAVLEEGEADWVLAADVTHCKLPDASLTMEGVAEIEWSLLRGDGEVVWQETLRTTARATPDDAREFEDRGRIAVQRAVQANVKKALQAIGRLELLVEG